MKYILIGIVVVGIIYMIFQAIGLVLILSLMKKQEEKPERTEHSDAEPAAHIEEEQP